MNHTDHNLHTPPLPHAPPGDDKAPPDAAAKGNLDLDDPPQINNQHLELR